MALKVFHDEGDVIDGTSWAELFSRRGVQGTLEEVSLFQPSALLGPALLVFQYPTAS